MAARSAARLSTAGTSASRSRAGSGCSAHSTACSPPTPRRRNTMPLELAQHIPGETADGRPLQAAVFDEHQVRAAAGLTMVAGAVAFAYAYFEHEYVLLQGVATFFFVDFAVRLSGGLRFSPAGVVAGLMTRRTAPEWVSAKPERFAWRLGLAMSFAMTIITNSGIRGTLPRTICA